MNGRCQGKEVDSTHLLAANEYATLEECQANCHLPKKIIYKCVNGICEEKEVDSNYILVTNEYLTREACLARCQRPKRTIYECNLGICKRKEVDSNHPLAANEYATLEECQANCHLPKKTIYVCESGICKMKEVDQTYIPLTTRNEYETMGECEKKCKPPTPPPGGYVSLSAPVYIGGFTKSDINNKLQSWYDEKNGKYTYPNARQQTTTPEEWKIWKYGGVYDQGDVPSIGYKWDELHPHIENLGMDINIKEHTFRIRILPPTGTKATGEILQNKCETAQKKYPGWQMLPKFGDPYYPHPITLKSTKGPYGGKIPQEPTIFNYYILTKDGVKACLDDNMWDLKVKKIETIDCPKTLADQVNKAKLHEEFNIQPFIEKDRIIVIHFLGRTITEDKQKKIMEIPPPVMISLAGVTQYTDDKGVTYPIPPGTSAETIEGYLKLALLPLPEKKPTKGGHRLSINYKDILEEQDAWKTVNDLYKSIDPSYYDMLPEIEEAPIEIFSTAFEQLYSPEEEALEEATEFMGLLSPQEFEEALENDTEPFLHLKDLYREAFPEASEEFLPMFVRSYMLKHMV